jgi:hypothetical protein
MCGIGGRVTEVCVRAESLDDGAPAALRDSLSVFVLIIDFDRPAEHIAAALEELLQEGFDSGRLVRCRSNSKADPDTEAGPTT